MKELELARMHTSDALCALDRLMGPAGDREDYEKARDRLSEAAADLRRYSGEPKPEAQLFDRIHQLAARGLKDVL